MGNCRFYIILLCSYLICQSIFSQILSFNRSTNWKDAGYPGTTPVYNLTRNIINFGGNGNGIEANDVAFANAVNSLGGQDGNIYFPAGVFVFNSPIVLRSHLVLKGAGSAATTLQFHLGGRFSCINVSGRITPATSDIASTALKGASNILVENPALFSANDYIKIYQNDAALVHDSWALESVGQIVRVDSIKNNLLYFSNALRRHYAMANTPRVRKLEMIEGVGIECLKIKRMDSTPQQTANIRFSNAANCWVKGIESDTCNYAHIQLAGSVHVSITNNYFHHAFAYGQGGQGYGISCEYTSGECLIENNIFRRLRHAMLLQTGANANVFAYNYATEPFKTDTLPYDFSGDIVLHGNYPYLNLFEGNIVQNIVVDASHGINGPFNTFFRNRAEGYGLFVVPTAGDSTNIVGNEISGTGFLQGNYYAFGNGIFHYGNNKNDTIIPQGTALLQDKSYIYSGTPNFWNSTSLWAGIGPQYNELPQSIPAKDRFVSSEEKTFCLSSTAVSYRFTGNGNWSDETNWEGNLKPSSVLAAGSEIIIAPPVAQKCVLNINYVIQPGVKLIIMPSKIAEVRSHLTIVK